MGKKGTGRDLLDEIAMEEAVYRDVLREDIDGRRDPMDGTICSCEQTSARPQRRGR